MPGMTTPGGRWVPVDDPHWPGRADWVPTEQPASPDGRPGVWHVVTGAPGQPSTWEWHPSAPPMPAQPPAAPQQGWAQPSPVYAQAVEQRRRKWPWIAAALVVLAVAIGAANSGGPDSSATLTTAGQDTTAAAKGVDSTKGFPLQDGDWRLDSLTMSKDIAGDFTGHGQITYTGADKGGGDTLIQITIYTTGNQVASMSATVDNVPPGRSKTIEFFSQDDYVPGSHRFTFQAGYFN